MKAIEKKIILLAGIIVTAGFILGFPFSGKALADDSVTIAPSKIILNAQGSWEDVQAVIRVPLKPGYQVDAFYATLSFGDYFITDTDVYFYCYLDSNFIASFDREEIQSVCSSGNITGDLVAAVEGEFSACNGDGSDCYHQTFSGQALVQVLAPGGTNLHR